MDDLAKLASRLSDIAQNRQRPLGEDIDWPPAVDPDSWYTSPELISLHGTPTYDELTDAQRKRLSLFEAANFFSLNIHGERALIAGLAERLYASGRDDEVSRYLQHFLDEENKHLYYFSRFCQKYVGKIYPDRKVTFPRTDFAPGEEDVLFFARVLIFEELVDVYNVRLAQDDRLPPIVRRINDLHHRDETHHLAFGRAIVAHLFARSAPAWTAQQIADVRAYVASYLRTVWYEYYNPEVYADAGLDRPYELASMAMESESRAAHRRSVAARCESSLRAAGLLVPEVPA